MPEPVVQPQTVAPVRLYLEECYAMQQECLLIAAGLSQPLLSLEQHDKIFSAFILENSEKCIPPKELGISISGNILSSETLFSEKSTGFVLYADHVINLGQGSRSSIKAYMLEHNVAFSKLHALKETAEMSNKVDFTYHSQQHINTMVYPENQKKTYILNDTLSKIRGQQYLFIYYTS